MVPPPVDYMDITARFAGLPSMAPRPSATNINAFEDAVVDILSTIPSAQSEDHGYRGLIESGPIYALATNVPWQNLTDPGITRRGTALNPSPLGNNLTASQARNEEAVWQAQTTQFMSEKNVRRAVIDALNTDVPKSYRRTQGAAGGIGHQTYKATQEPRDIMIQLRANYGKASPGEKEANDNQFKLAWNVANDTIEDLFSRFEDCYRTALRATPAYTMEQLIDRAITSIQLTGLYSTALLQWNGETPANDLFPR